MIHADIITAERERKLFRIISRQTLCEGDAAWLEENIPRVTDWPSATRIAFNDGLASFFYCHCRNLGLLKTLPEDTRKLFSRIYAETLLINQHLLKVMEELARELEKRAMHVIVLKGAALLNAIYRDVALRPMEDIDLMVREEDLGELRDVLGIMGFVQNKLYPNTFNKGILSIDLHLDYLSSHRIRSRRDILSVRSADVWNRAIPCNESAALYRLSPCDSLIALSFHLLKHRYDRLIWFVDIAESIEKHRSATMWSDIVGYSRKVNASRILLYALLLAKHLIGVNVADDVLINLGKENISRIEKYLLRLRLVHARPGTVMDLLWLFQIRGAGRKIRFVTENVFPQREVMDQIFPSSPHHFRTFLRRSALVSSQVISDHLLSIRSVLKSGLPRL